MAFTVSSKSASLQPRWRNVRCIRSASGGVNTCPKRPFNTSMLQPEFDCCFFDAAAQASNVRDNRSRHPARLAPIDIRGNMDNSYLSLL